MRNMVRWVQSIIACILCILMGSVMLKAQQPVNRMQPTTVSPQNVQFIEGRELEDVKTIPHQAQNGAPRAQQSPSPAIPPSQQAPLQQDQQPDAPQEGQPDAVEQKQPVEQESMPIEQPSIPQELPEEPASYTQEPPAVVQPPLGPDEIRGIDTVDIQEEEAQGNWLYKRVWWERAEAKYEKIRGAVNKIFEMRTSFFAKRTELDKNILDPFYIKIGLSQGELQEILSELIAKTSQGTKERDGEILEQAEDEKSELEQLQKEVQQVVKQDTEVEDAILMLVDQLNKIRRLEQQAWQNFKNIARVLDDKKARELFYRVDNAWRNIQEMQAYIEKTFTTSFDTLIERIKERIKKIDSAILALKEKGVDLKKRVQTEEQEEQEEDETPPGFFARYVSIPLKNFFNSIWSAVRWPYDKIMGKKADEDQEEESDEESEVTAPAQEQSQSAENVSMSVPRTMQPAQVPAFEQTDVTISAEEPEGQMSEEIMEVDEQPADDTLPAEQEEE